MHAVRQARQRARPYHLAKIKQADILTKMTAVTNPNRRPRDKFDRLFFRNRLE